MRIHVKCHFVSAGKPNFWGAGVGAGITSKLLAIASDQHPGANTSMPQPLGAKDVCYTEKKVGTKIAFLGRLACVLHTNPESSNSSPRIMANLSTEGCHGQQVATG